MSRTEMLKFKGLVRSVRLRLIINKFSQPKHINSQPFDMGEQIECHRLTEYAYLEAD